MMEFATKLMQHQIAAVKKLEHLKVGALYMEQGTGKTRVTLSLVKKRLDAGKVDCVLWLCPCSVKNNLREDIMYHCGEEMPKEIIIKGLESLSSSSRLYMKLTELVQEKNVFLVVDESSLIKNHYAIRTGRVTAMSRCCQYKLILNGTPVTKNEADLFAQWFILDWRILGYKSFFSFAANHLEYKEIRDTTYNRMVRTNQVARVLNIDYLTEKISPYTYQIRKDECLKLPKKYQYPMSFGMARDQRDEYDYVKYSYLEAVDEIKPSTIYKLFTALQHVVSGRIVCTGPHKKMKTKRMFNEDRDNPRIKRLREIIEENIGDEKCIIFAKYQSEIDSITELIRSMGMQSVMFTGKISQKHRQENRLKFKQEVQFLVANKVCGAYGLNLQFCHNIIYYSNDFDLGTRLQSEDRVHRIGQTHEVSIYDLYCRDTIDETILNCLNKKGNLLESFKQEIHRWRHENVVTYKKFSVEDNPDFYLFFGPIFASREIRNDLDGYPLSNEDNWVWITALERNEMLGFLALEPIKNGYHIHATYVFPESRKKGILKQMLSRAVDYGKDGLITVTVRDYLQRVYEDNGFIVKNRRGKKWVNMRREPNAKSIHE